MSDVQTEDLAFDRMMLRRRAMSAEGRNRPVWMPVLAGLFVVIAGMWVLSSAGVTGKAKRTHRIKLNEASQITTTIESLKKLQLQLEDTGAVAIDNGGEGPTPVTIINDAADRFGVTIPSVPRPRSERAGDGLEREIYTCQNVTNADVEVLLGWVDEVRREAPWLTVGFLQLQNLGTAGWKIEVSFERLRSTR